MEDTTKLRAAMSEHTPAYERCLDRSLPREQQPRAAWMRDDRDRIRALEAENARLREALSEAVAEVDDRMHDYLMNHEHEDAARLEDLLTRLRAAL